MTNAANQSVAAIDFPPQTRIDGNSIALVCSTMKTETVFELDEWNNLVRKTYGRPYHFQQQDGCKNRGLFRFTVPADADDFENDTVPEEVNHETMGVSFAAWLGRDPKQRLSNPDDQEDYCIELWWDRNFYPQFQMVANDLCSRGILPAGSYAINIDW